MITRHHVMLALLCSLIISSATAGSDPILILVLTGGTGIGVILPDNQMKRPKKTCLLTVAWYIVQIGRQICIPVMCRIYRILTGKIIKPDDKHLTHSIPGILLYFTILAGIIAIPAILFRNSISGFLAMVFLGGVILGLCLHLVEDLCTRKGIAVFFPFTETMINGSIRPCDIHDNRIRLFHIQHGSILGIIVILQVVVKPADFLITCGLLGIFTCIVSMVWQSDVRIILPENRFSDTREVIPA